MLAAEGNSWVARNIWLLHGLVWGFVIFGIAALTSVHRVRLAIATLFRGDTTASDQRTIQQETFGANNSANAIGSTGMEAKAAQTGDVSGDVTLGDKIVHHHHHERVDDPRVNDLIASVEALKQRKPVMGMFLVDQNNPPGIEHPLVADRFEEPRAKRLMDFEGFSTYRTLTLCVPLGTQYPSVLAVKNYHKSPKDVLYNVRASIAYSLEGIYQFTVAPVIWFVESSTGYGRSDFVDLGWNEVQRFPVFMTRQEQPNRPGASQLLPQVLLPQTAMWYGSSGNETARGLEVGLWTARITVTADNHEPIVAEIEFTVHPQLGKRLLTVSCAPDATRLRIDCSGKDAQRQE